MGNSGYTRHHSRLKAAGAPELGHNANAEGDASDAGMVFSQMPGGKTDATMEEIKIYFLGQAKGKTPAPAKAINR